MKTALMVAEKPSLAQALAQILSHGKMKSRKGINNVCSVHEYDGFFKNEPTKFKVTSVCGHVKSLDFISKYNNWDTVDPIELFEAQTKKKEANPELRMPQHLQREALGCDYLILWLDCDKEGENICFEVIQITLPHLKQWFSNMRQAIFRARFSAVAERDVREAMAHLGEPNENESRSVDARQELDLRIGCAFTRFQTKYFQGKYSNLDSSLISFGPCQTPTLGFCVDRYDQIQNFKSEPYWVMHVQIKTPGNKTLTLDWHHGSLFDVEVARFYLNSIKDCTIATVTSVKSKECTTPRPQALNTVELMRVASSGLGIGSHQAMQIAERLYTQGYISYPRTETTQYPDSFDHKEILNQLRSNSQYSEVIRNLYEDGISKPRKGHDAGDHPPITPMKVAHRDDLEAKTWKIYDYIARHFIATVSRDMLCKQTTATLDIGGEKFTCQGLQVLDPGYTQVFPWQAPSEEDTLPPLAEGDHCQIKEMRLDERQTQPPDYLTEAELITLMEKHGIGTDASIPVHINNICERHYVTVESGRRLVPTTLGTVLVHSYKQIDPELVLPTMRAAVEKQLNLIAQGKADHSAVLHHTLTIFLLKFIYFVTSISEMNELFSQSFTSLADSGKPFTRCGKCRRYLKLITNPTNKLHCQNCRETLSLPRGGNLREYKEFECPLDDYQLIQWSGGSKGKSFILCPYCYNHPPFEDMLLGNGCNNCSHPDCPHSLANWSSISCSSCPYGIFVLDPHSGPPNWKLSCNRCDAILFLCEGATKLKVDQNQCPECLRQLFSIEYKKENTKLPEGKTKALACPFCEPELSALVNFSTAQKALPHRPQSNRGRGGRRRGPRH